MDEPKKYPYMGDMLTIRSISELTGVPRDTIRRRLRKGMPYERAFSADDLRVERLKKWTTIYIDYYGERLTVTELSERTGIKRTTIMDRWRCGDRGERLWRPVEKRASSRKAWYERY